MASKPTTVHTILEHTTPTVVQALNKRDPRITSRFINPRTDFGFKKIFGEANSLKEFLNSFLPAHHQIESLEYQPVDDLPETHDGKQVIYDLLCKNEKGEYFLVELQNQNQVGLVNRFLYYSARLMTSQLKKAQAYEFIMPVYCFYVLNFSLPYYEIGEQEQDIECDATDAVHHFLFRSADERAYKLSDLWHCYFIQLPKFAKDETELVQVQDKWLYLLQNLDTMEHIPKSFEEDKRFSAVFEIAESVLLKGSELNKYLAENDQELQEKARLKFAENKGREEGKAEGLAQGRVEIARKLIEQGVDIKTISLATGLSEDELAALQGKSQS